MAFDHLTEIYEQAVRKDTRTSLSLVEEVYEFAARAGWLNGTFAKFAISFTSKPISNHFKMALRADADLAWARYYDRAANVAEGKGLAPTARKAKANAESRRDLYRTRAIAFTERPTAI